MNFGPPHDYTDGKGFSDNDFATFIADILKSEIEYIKSGRLVIDVSGAMDRQQIKRFLNLLRLEIQKDKYAEIDG